MKLILLTLLITSNVFAFRILPQEGNGGNVCKLDDAYITLDEYIFPEMNHPLPPVYQVLPLKVEVLWMKHGEYIGEWTGVTDLANSVPGQAAAEIIKKYGKNPGHEKFSLMMLDALKTMEKIYIYNGYFKKPKSPGVDPQFCDYLKAAIITDKNLITLLSYAMWHRLSLESQKVLILHEVLRIMQITMPWLYTLGNFELNQMTMFVYSNTPLDKRLNFFLKALDEFLAKNPMGAEEEKTLITMVLKNKNLKLQAMVSVYTNLYHVESRLSTVKGDQFSAFSRVFNHMKFSVEYENKVNKYLSTKSSYDEF